MTHAFHIVDVFATERYAGNQLAVFEDAADLSGSEMQSLAGEMNYSETTFVEGTTPPYPVRIFTPREEIPFAGHPTLGTAAVLEAVVDATPPITLELGVGEVAVTREGDTFWMAQHPPEFLDEFDHGTLADVLSVPVDRLDADFPVVAVSTGLPTTIVPLADRAALTSVEVDRDAYDEFVAGHEARNVLAVCPDPRDPARDLAVRVFAPYYDVPEDPATGSSNGCLGAYCRRYGYPDGSPVDYRVEQGYEMGRPSLLSVRAPADDDAVHVGGRVIPVASGRLRDGW